MQGGRSRKDFAGGLGFAGGGDSGGYGTFHRPVEQRREDSFIKRKLSALVSYREKQSFHVLKTSNSRDRRSPYPIRIRFERNITDILPVKLV